MPEERDLVRKSAAVADERADASDNAMTRDQDANRISPHGAADRLRGHPLASKPFRDAYGNLAKVTSKRDPVAKKVKKVYLGHLGTVTEKGVTTKRTARRRSIAADIRTSTA